MRKLLLLLTVLFGSTFAAMASHVMGSDITYKCISNKKFEITLKIYRDCRGIPLGSPGQFSIVCASGGTTRGISYQKTSIKDITPKCRASANPCNPQNTTVSAEGVEEHTYVGTIDFNVSPLSTDVANGCCEFRIFYDECCRNGAINTGSAGNFYSDALINICRAPCNNSPKMTNEPIAYLCCNQPFTFNNGVTDTTDYDSISYELGVAKEGAGTNFSYGGGYSATKPLTPYTIGNPNLINPNANPPIGFFLDPVKGDIIFTPTGCSEVGPVVIQVNEWRKDSTGTYRKIGETRRDLQFIVRTCPGNNPPSITGSAGYNYNVCEGNQLCFNIITRDQQFIVPPPQTSAPPDSIEVSWNNGIGGATFTVDSVTTITGGTNGALSQRNARFCWTPALGKASSLPYTFTVTAKDNSCNPRPAASTRAFSIIVKPIAQADRVYTILPCGKVKFQAFPKSNFVTQFSWTVRDSLNQPITTATVNKPTFNKALDTLTFKKGGKYIVTLSVNNPPHNCSNLYIDTIIVPQMLQVDLALTNDTFVCAGNSITLKASVKYGADPFRYRWITGATNDTLDTKAMTPGADSIAAIRVTDKNLCVVYDTVRIKYIPLPVIDLGPDKRICDYDSTTFDAGNPGKRFEWNTTQSTQVITAKAAGEYIVRVLDSLGCFSRDTVILNVNDHVQADAGTDRELCRGDTIKIGAGGANTTGGKTNSYQWSFISGSNKYSNEGDTISVWADQETFFELLLQTTQSSVMCVSYDTTKASINELPILNKGFLEDRCYDFGEINLNNDGAFTPKGGIYTYEKNPSVMVGGTTFNTKDVGNKDLKSTVYFLYTYTDDKGCVSKDSIPQTIFRLPAVVIMDTTYCRNVGPRDLKEHVITPKVNVGGIENWYAINESGAITKTGNKFYFDPAFRPAPYSYTVVYEFTDPNGCTNRDTARITIIDVPTIDFGTKAGPYCMDAGLVDLSTATSVSPSGGKWMCRQYPSLVGPDSAFLNTAVTSGTFFFQYIHRSTGCLVVDSIEITINPLPIVSINIPAGKGTICTSENPFQVQGTPAGGTFSSPGASKDIITPGGLLNASKKPNDGLETGAYELWYNYTDPVTKCKNVAKTIIRIQEQPRVQLFVDEPGKCEGNNFNLKADSIKYTAGVTWDSDGSDAFANSTNSSSQYQPTTADIQQGVVNITVTTIPNGVCPTTTASLPINIWRIPQGNFVGDPTEGCAPHQVSYELTLDPNVNAGVVSYLWNFGDPNSGTLDSSTLQDPTHIYTLEGKYDVSVKMTSEHGCSKTLSVADYITVYPVPTANFDVDPQTRFTTIALPKFNFINKSSVSSGSFTSAWDFGVVDIDADTSTQKNGLWTYSNSPKDTGTYIVTLIITTDGGCTDIHIDSIRIGPDLTVFIPNAFSPNRFGPGINNKFYVSAQGFASFEINIFNRWGEKLFHSTDINEGWDGTYKGQEAQQDVYVYQVNVTSFSGKVYKYNGTITLIR